MGQRKPRPIGPAEAANKTYLFQPPAPAAVELLGSPRPKITEAAKKPVREERPAAADRKRRKESSEPDRSGSRSKKREKMSSGDQVRASHILVKHQGSRRKASWKDPDGRVICATTRDAAVVRLLAFRDDIVAGKVRFEDVASRHSDCSSAKRGGDLGPFGRGQMQKPFEEATYALKVGEMSDIVETDSGVHIILRTG